jgi:hypothetical protein
MFVSKVANYICHNYHFGCVNVKLANISVCVGNKLTSGFKSQTFGAYRNGFSENFLHTVLFPIRFEDMVVHVFKYCVWFFKFGLRSHIQ